jgi:cobalt/nickel transport system permease protein
LALLERALSHVASLDELARRASPVASLDARAKVLAAFCFLVTIASFGRHDLVRPLPLLIYLAVGMALGDVPFRMVVARLAIASPFALLVAIWNPLFETRPLLQVGAWAISAGWVSFFNIIERFVLALAAVLLLVATTGMDPVTSALGRLGMPRVLVTQLMLLYRYGFLLGAEASRMLRAHALRVPAQPRPTLQTLRSLLGELLLRSISRAERVHRAMLCRGFDGELRRMFGGRFTARDAGFLIGSIAFFLLVRVVDVPRFIARFVP